MGDLSELIASIAEKGILEPLVVRQRGDRFQIVAGERRYQAAVQVGAAELPVVVRDVDEAEMLELALIENLQRKDLTAFEEAEALQGLAEQCGYTHEDLARRLGKSRDLGDRVAGAHGHARGGPHPLSAGRHFVQVAVIADS
jgi:ParB family chromosome partitioning protein